MRELGHTVAAAWTGPFGPANTELLYFEAAIELNYRIQDPLHCVGVNQVTLRLYNLLLRKCGVTWIPVLTTG